MQTLYNPDWTFIINFLSIFLGALSIVITFKFSFERKLGLIIWDTSTIKETDQGGLTASTQLHKLNVAFQNLGKETIYKADLVGKIKIELKNLSQVEMVSFESNCKFNTINFEIEKETILFDFDFLEGRKYIKVHIGYYSEEIIDARISGKIIGGNEISTKINSDTTWEKSYRVGEKDARAKIFVFPFISLVLISLSVQAFIKMFKIDFEYLSKVFKSFNKESFITILIGLSIIGICVAISNSITKIFIPYATFMKKEKNWYLK